MIKQVLALFFTVTLCVHTPLGFAEIYKIINPDGSASFSDQPSEDTAPLPNQPVQPNASPTQPQKPAVSPPASKEKGVVSKDKKPTRYTALRIRSPKHDEAIRSNEGNVTVALAIVPLLNSEQGDTITLFLDGEAVAKPSNLTVFTLSNVTRGSHTLSATLKDKNGAQLLTSPTITFHLLKAHVHK